MRLAVLVTHPVQYFAPIFRELAQRPDLQLKVFFGCDHGVMPSEDPNFGVVFKWDCQPTEGFEHEFLSTSSLESLQGLAGMQLATKAAVMIGHYKPDTILIFSYSPAFITTSTLLLRLAGHKLMLRAETTDEAVTRSYFKDKIRQIMLGLYYRQFTYFFPIGTNSINHYRRMGVDENRLTLAFYAIDVDYFQKQVDFWLPQREFLRTTAGIKPQDCVLMYCGKMFPDKNPLLISDAIAMLLPEEKEKIWLIAVGEGELRQEFEVSAKAQLEEKAIFVGFKNQSELGKYYAMSDILILPSLRGETWGLVINEAFQFGLKVIVSDKVGSGRDLIINTDKGWIFSSGNLTELYKMISNAIATPKSLSIEFEKLPHPKQLAQAIHLKIKNHD
ncbi:MAG: glycosyltransferase family 4 protein [Nostocaceae cyanobacterium]|nr:glycosyltransferase family 4 protein [Nostocaceae cyanobacterium]